MDAVAVSTRPVIVSHSNSKAIWDHQRNIPDELAKAVAATGGVIGVNGVGLFLSSARSDASAEAIARHVNHYAELVGPRHVGMGLDSVYDLKFYMEGFARKNMDRYRTGGYFKGTPQFAGVDVIPRLAGLLLESGWNVDDVRGFLGENWLRVLEQSW